MVFGSGVHLLTVAGTVEFRWRRLVRQAVVVMRNAVT